MKDIMDGEIYMWQSCVEIEVIPSHFIASFNLSAVSLNFRSSSLSPQGSQLRIHGYFSTVK